MSTPQPGTPAIADWTSRFIDHPLFKRLAMVAERMSNAAVVTDCESRIVWVNASFTGISGYSLEEIVGKVPGQFLQCEETDQHTVAQIRRAIRSGSSFQGELLNKNKNGDKYWLELDIQPIFDEQGTHTGFLALQTDITTRKETEIALREAEEFQKGIFDALPARIVVLDHCGVVLKTNENWRRFIENSGIDRGAFELGSNYLLNADQLCGADKYAAQEIRRGIHKVLHSELSVFHTELHLQTFEVPQWLELTVTPFRRSGKTQLVIAHTDITNRKLSELKLSRKEHKLRSIYESSSDAILLLDESGEILECNERAVRLLGGDTAATLVGLDLVVFSPLRQHDGERSVAKFQQHLNLAMATGKNRFEWDFVSGNGCDLPSEVFFTVLSDYDRKLVQCTVRDISERRDSENWLKALQNELATRILAEKTLRETTGYLDAYRNIVDHHAIVAETDTAGTILSVNDAFCKISGYSRDELIGQNHRILNSGHHPKAMWTHMYKTVANGGHWHGEICNRAKDGQLYWVDTTIAPLFDAAGKVRGYFSIRADITSLKSARVAAEAASRSKSEFLANMSHEIRTPMTAILGYADLLAEYLLEVQAEERTREYVQTIKRNGDHLLSIINDILDISKIEADKMTIEQIAVSPALVVREVMTLMNVKAQAKGIQLEAYASTTTPSSIQTDPTRLRQILVNLVGNAIKFTEVGSVKVIIHVNPAFPKQLCFEVQDTGIGLSEQQLSQLFQAFEQADTSMTRKFGGTGLGLRISKRLAMMLGGDISVSSTLGQGSIFSVRIDTGEISGSSMLDATQVNQLLAGGQAVTNTTKTEMNPATRKQLDGLRILLAEDGPDNQRLITFLLRKAGAEVQLVENGKLAVEALTQDATTSGRLLDPLPFDLILMDMQMPILDGYEATRLLLSKGCKIPILALTAHAMSSELAKCTDAGCSFRITKPVDRAVLIDACLEWGRKQIPAPALQPITTTATSPTIAKLSR
ncbi:MAG: PAS domain S-box protein [Pirellulaceae bacterium]|nr:PAS domain S-box protein [Pirellulaceae bacterium]